MKNRRIDWASMGYFTLGACLAWIMLALYTTAR